MARADGVEVYNTLDDDCDGQVDEGTDLATDEANRGACGAGEVCDPAGGQCVPDLCASAHGSAGKLCVGASGACIANPCATTLCPQKARCAVLFDGSPYCSTQPAAQLALVHPVIVRRGGGGFACSLGGRAGSARASAATAAVTLLALACLRRRRAARRCRR